MFTIVLEIHCNVYLTKNWFSPFQISKWAPQRFFAPKCSITNCAQFAQPWFGWRENFVNGEVPESNGLKNVRTSRKNFEELNAKLHSFLLKQKIELTEPISTEVQLVQNSSEPKSNAEKARFQILDRSLNKIILQ